MISAVILDAFGTAVRIRQRTNPYGALFREGRRQGVALTPNCPHFVMTANLTFDQVAEHLGIELSPSKRAEMNAALGKELASVEPYPDALDAIAKLQEAGVIIGICSNLAQPFGSVVRKAFPHVQCHAFSYELGIMKPTPEIYLALCREMGVEAGHGNADKGRVVMIGDSRKCDRDGPKGLGIMGYHLDRSDLGQISDLTQFANQLIGHDCAE
jgi:FMN phosphatase YigB (HAD superfamily)